MSDKFYKTLGLGASLINRLPSALKSAKNALSVRRREFYDQLWDDAAAHVGATISDLGYGYRKIERNEQYTFVKADQVMLDNQLILKMAGNKALIYKLLQDYGVPTLPHLVFDFKSLSKAYQFLHEHSAAPVVVKPLFGTGGGAGVTTHITTEKDLKKAAFCAAAFCRQMMIEPQLEGASYRLLFLDGKFIDAVRRDPPSVMGDGRKTIKELISDENSRRLTSEKVIALRPIAADMECRLMLTKQGRKLDDVPKLGESVVVKNVVNENSSSENHNVRDEVHPYIIRLCREVLATLKIEHGGLDIIAPNLSEPLSVTGGIINEVNTVPGLHHHILVSNNPNSHTIISDLLEHLLQKSS